LRQNQPLNVESALRSVATVGGLATARKRTLDAVKLAHANVPFESAADRRRQQQNVAKLKADAQKVVSIISSDKAKTQTFCQMVIVGKQVDEAIQEKDNKKAVALSGIASALHRVATSPSPTGLSTKRGRDVCLKRAIDARYRTSRAFSGGMRLSENCPIISSQCRLTGCRERRYSKRCRQHDATCSLLGNCLFLQPVCARHDQLSYHMFRAGGCVLLEDNHGSIAQTFPSVIEAAGLCVSTIAGRCNFHSVH
jgi:hypothetical protein